MGAVQNLAWPKSCLYVPIKPTETRTRSIPVAGTLTALFGCFADTEFRKPSVEVGEIEGGWGRRTQKVLLNV